FEESITIEGETISPETEGEADVLIAKFTADGELVWLQNQTTPVTSTSIAVSSNKFYTSGTFRNTMEINGEEYVSYGYQDAYLCSYDVNGDLNWVLTAGGEGMEYLSIVSTDGFDNAYWSGEFTSDGTMNFIDEVIETEPTDGHVYLSKITPDGELDWLRRFGNDSDDSGWDNYNCWPTDIITTDEGITYLKGWNGDGVYFGDILLENSFEDGSYSYFVGKFASDGEPIWINTIAEKSYGFDYNNMDIDIDGNIYFGAEARDDIRFDETLYEPEGSDLFIAKYSNDGEFVWAKTLIGEIGDNNFIASVCEMDGTSLYFAGNIENKLIFNDNTYHSAELSGFVAMLGTYEEDDIEELQKCKFNIYPNPTHSGLINIENKKNNKYQLSIYDISGNIILEKSINQKRKEISLKNLSKGVYIFLINDSITTGIKKVIYK
ncbi:MAG: T9SS type A sorting domain-containing protein, partial [Bacteroidota bacterium]|nr:T9SS type A sorting domain-containing protein [Bacteroidota bacterium]